MDFPPANPLPISDEIEIEQAEYQIPVVDLIDLEDAAVVDQINPGADAALVRTWKASWLRDHDWLRFDGKKCWCEPCKLFPYMASKKSQLNKKEGYCGEPKSGFKYDAIINHYLRKGTKELVEEHSACYRKWIKIQSRDDEATKDIKSPKTDLMDVYVQQGLEEKLLQLGRIANTAHFGLKKI
jgi:hypothetical protein